MPPENSDREITLRPAKWPADRGGIELVRRAVFIEEQSVSESEEWDDSDPVCEHVLALSENRDVVGTGRLDATGKIGRVAVLQKYRGTGVGSALMRHLVNLAKESGITEVYLNAQTAATEFYERFGFRAEGPEFEEAGIPHRLMRRPTGRIDDSQAGRDGNKKPFVDAG